LSGNFLSREEGAETHKTKIQIQTERFTVSGILTREGREFRGPLLFLPYSLR